MRLQLRHACALLVGLATLLAMAATGTANAAPVAGSDSSGAAARTQATTNTPQLTTNTNASCNAKPEKGHARCFAVVRTPEGHEITPMADEPPPTALGPADIRDAYRLPADQGVGQTVAIVDAGDDADAEADLAVFRSQYGLPPCTTDNGCFTKVNQRGEQGNYPPDAGWGIEISLDLDAVSAACPLCHILLVEADNNNLANLGAAVETAVSLGAKFVSNSWGLGGNEVPNETDYDHYFDHKGVAITFSSGDSPHPNWPASNPHVTAAGGTRLTRDDSTDRGWTEVPWTSGGAGCSAYEPKPDYQSANGLDTHCDMRATADISADADPASGLAVYDSNDGRGWVQVGGTSLSSPLIAAMYALAGTPVAGTYPVTYPYDVSAHQHVFDITEGSNGNCGNLLCEAVPGWDGPTGWGTPNGVAALRTGPHGDVAGTITDADTGNPIANATVSTPEGYQARTGSDGKYDLIVPVGSYDITASAFGYAEKTVTGVTVTKDQATTEDFTLTTVARVTLSGTVTDGSGHGWPLYAKIAIPGTPVKPVYTDPYTGRYSVNLPQQATYTLHVAAVAPGYELKDVTVEIGTEDVQQSIALAADRAACTAPGYVWTHNGAHTEFTGWAGATPQDGWTVTDDPDSGDTWRFDNDWFYSSPPSADSDIAYVIPQQFGNPPVDTALVSPTVDLSDQTSPEVGFDSFEEGLSPNPNYNRLGTVDLSLDGGLTWTTVWTSQTLNGEFDRHVDIPIPQAAAKTSVKVRFHIDLPNGGADWALDNVFVGSRSCAAALGGLVAGVVTDANTGGPVNGATLSGTDQPAESGTTAATPDDANLPDGFYELFSPGTGDRQLTATDRTVHGAYVPATATLEVTPDTVARQDFTMQSGHLTASTSGVTVNENMGDAKTARVTVGNDGTAPMHVRLGERASGITPLGDRLATRPAGAPLQEAHVPAALVTGPLGPAGLPTRNTGNSGGDTDQPADVAPGGPAWLDMPDLPEPMTSNVVAYHGGKLYSVTGYNGAKVDYDTAHGYVYDTTTNQWTRIADAPRGLQSATGGFLDGKLYVVGGWYLRDGDQFTSSASYAYDPVTDRWSRVADLPQQVAGARAAVLNGKLYVIGGCGNLVGPSCTSSVTEVAYRYDPAGDTWTRLADYPVAVTEHACAGIAGKIACAGGYSADGILASTYVYDPGGNTWTQGADMPYDDYQMAASAANGKLVIAGGQSGGFVHNRVAAYDPVTDTWIRLPNANEPLLLAGGACGFYDVGGYDWSGAAGFGGPTPLAEVLPGWDQCGDADDVSWLAENNNELDLAPGESVTVRVRMDSSVVDQPGDYAGELFAMTDSPYAYQPVKTTMHVDPPVTWGAVAGTVTDAGTGNPIANATVQLCSNFRGGRGGCGPMTKTLRTDATGHYQWWLDIRYTPLQVVASSDHYLQQVRRVRIRRGKTATVDFALHKFG